MNTLFVVIAGAVVIYLAYNFYAKRIDRNVIQANDKKATPAKMYMDGVDFMPASRNVLYGYHFKSIAAAGPIVGVITAANLWGWLPAILWLLIGVSFIGWVSDYSAIMLSVRNDGNSLSAIAHRLIAPRTRTVMFVFIFFYLLLIAGAFIGILAAILAARPDVPFGIFILAIMGLVGSYLLYKRKMSLVPVTAIIVGVTLIGIVLGPLGQTRDDKGALVQGPFGQIMVGINNGVNSLTGGQALYTVVDPTFADPRIPAPAPDPNDPTKLVRAKTAVYDPATNNISTLPAYIFWALMLFVFSYLGANLPIWRFAQPVNYIGFWITLLTIVLSAAGAILAPFTSIISPLAADKGAAIANFALPAVKDLGFTLTAGAAWQPIWPMLFVTIACGAISGWHALFGSVGTARQLEYETDALPVGGGAMFSENTLALLSLVAVSIVGTGGGGGRFAEGVGKLLYAATFGALPLPLGTALGFASFVIIVLTVTQLVFRVMRVTLAEWVGERMPAMKNMHVATIISMIFTLALVLTGTWVYLWQLFGASNQLMAALSLLVVTVWLKSEKRNPAFALWPMLFMYITTIAATIVNARNLLETIALKQTGLPQIGAWAMIGVSALLVVAALLIGYDGWKAYRRYSKGETPSTAPAPVAGG
jgi:carbon starvation protein